MLRQHTQGPWRMGDERTLYGAVVCDQIVNPNLPTEDLERQKAAYGGYLIAESILAKNRPLIAMAPELLDACEDAFRILTTCRFLHDRETARLLVHQATIRLEETLDKLETLQDEVKA